MKVSWRASMGILALLLSPGCATHHLWTESALSEKYAPTAEMRLQVFKLPSDFLVVYDEWSPRGAITRRAYFLQTKGASHKAKKPRFVEASLGQTGQPVPIFDQATIAVMETNSLWCLRVAPLAFELYDGGVYLGSFELPVYRAPANTTAQVFMTPLTVAADITVVAGTIWLLTKSPTLNCDFSTHWSSSGHAR